MKNKKTKNASGKSFNSCPVLAAVAAGLYPLLFYYSRNFTLINSWAHLVFFIAVFLICPIVLFVIANKLFTISALRKWQKYLLPFLNILVFLFLLKVCLYAGIQKKITLGILVLAVGISFFLYKYFKKFIILEFILAFIALLTLVPVIIKNVSYSSAWTEQPDAIKEVVFKQKPNVYYIQPDGYVNFSELKQGSYKIDNVAFETFLNTNNFKNYPDFRSNYASTLSSNSATFMMKHHYYNKGTSLSEALNARNIIISENPVLSAFKNNGYKTHFITERPYLLLNRPKMGYDFSNFTYAEVPYISTGLKNQKQVFSTLKNKIEEDQNTPKFFFIEIFEPGHIKNTTSASEGKKEEKENWKLKLDEANKKLIKLVKIIKQDDPEGLILIMADHGGYVGMEYAEEYLTKTQNRDKIYSMFSSNLSIYWPNQNIPEFDTKIKTSVNVFRVLFTYLSKDKKYLDNLQEDNSYIILNKDAPKGVYKYIDNSGNITFKKH